MSSPAERYAAARQRSRRSSVLRDFVETYPFALDPFQIAAAEAIEAGRGVLVAAPTGAGKTVVGEFAVAMAISHGGKCFYTTPIKALSNQKFNDLVGVYGAASVGLLTGDVSINGDAPIVVMTTEVLRNMIYIGSPALSGLSHVVMDEVHYLADRSRGAVWEEVILHLPSHITVVALSATVSNAEEFGEWLATVRGATDVIVEEVRPVPLWQHVMVGATLWDLFVDADLRQVNPELIRLSRDKDRRPSHRHRGRDERTPLRSEVVERLARTDLLPAITFIFSRAGCEAAVRQCVMSGLRLTSVEERDRIREYVARSTSDLPGEDLQVLGFDEWTDGLERGFAAHHAGLLPRFKEIVEGLFQEGLLKAVFATETLALGINMPARCVVLERLVKWNGEAHADLSASEYTQLTGRAGRRGIDVEGHAVVVWHPDLDPRALAGLASTRTYPLRSSFRPSYNMAVNLVARMSVQQAREVLETSFAQFQADRAVVGIASQMRREEGVLAEYRRSMSCHLGDFTEYAELRHRLSRAEREAVREGAAAQRAATAASLARLQTGDVIVIPTGRRSGPAVVLDPGLHAFEEPRPVVLTQDRQVRRLSIVDFTAPVATQGRVRIPRGFSERSASDRRELVTRLRAVPVDLHPSRRGKRARSEEAEETIAGLRAELRRHPCHGCADREEHARWADRARRLADEIRQASARIETRTNTIARQFDRVCEVLVELGYLDTGRQVTAAGEVLRRLHSESDLLIAECLRNGTWDALDPAGLAAVVSTVVFESRAREEVAVRLPGGAVRVAIEQTLTSWAVLEERERAHRLDLLREPDPGFALAIHRWVRGSTLAAVLADSDLLPGDFVRWSKQVVDVLGQIAGAAPETPIADTAQRASAAIARGVVAYGAA